VDPVSDPLLLRKFGSTRNLTQDIWVSSQELWPLDYRGGDIYMYVCIYNYVSGTEVSDQFLNILVSSKL
jgi:hypothetical protein